MKKTALMATAIMFFAATMFSACSGNTSDNHTHNAGKDTSSTQMAGLQYTCTMHPEVISNKPGKCPKCGMTLVEKTHEK